MNKIMFGVLLIFLWMLGIYEGDCTVAVGVTIVPMCYALELGLAIIKWQIHKRKMVRR